MNRPSVRFTTEAARLISLLHPETRRMIRLAIDELRKNPMLGDDLQEELSGFKSYKPKRYRIIYTFDDESNTINVYFVGHRKDVYQQFAQMLKKLNRA